MPPKRAGRHGGRRHVGAHTVRESGLHHHRDPYITRHPQVEYGGCSASIRLRGGGDSDSDSDAPAEMDNATILRHIGAEHTILTLEMERIVGEIKGTDLMVHASHSGGALRVLEAGYGAKRRTATSVREPPPIPFRTVTAVFRRRAVSLPK